MIAPAVFLAALSFWAPYNQGVVPCVNDVAADAVYVDFPTVNAQMGDVDQSTEAINATARIGDPPSAFGTEHIAQQPCKIKISRTLERKPKAYQAAVIAHEIGHAGMGLYHSTDKANIMYETQIVPGYFQRIFPVRRAHRRHHR